jgi:hypothetical protein
MKTCFLPMFFILVLSTINISAAVRYVNVNGANPLAPYTSWAEAATNIQDAINEAEAGDTVLVTNGIYQSGASFPEIGSNRVYLAKSLTVQSVNGPAVTVIQGYQAPGTIDGTNAVRCVYMSAGVLSGFTLTNGATLSDGDYFGGGVYCISTSCLVSNCIIAGNYADSGGGGANSGTLVNCILSGNSVGAFQSGGGGATRGSVLINCLLTQNFSASFGGAADECTLLNCTVVSNSAAETGGSLQDCTTKNTIAYYNFSDYTNADLPGADVFTNCCVSFNNNVGANNFTNPPLFANPAAGNYRLLPWSPCINAGNNSFITYTVLGGNQGNTIITNNTDLAGNPRIVGGTIDIGAYEFQSPLHFVRLTDTNPVAPFSTWLTAATNLQDAIDAANAGDLIVVSNGVYQSGATLVGQDALPNRIVIDQAITVQSLNGPAATIIAGNGAVGDASTGIRCAYLANGAVLSGFTLANGATQNSETSSNDENGGGVWCQSDSVVVTNCILTGNHAFANGGAAYQGTFDNCLIISNVASFGGGLYACIANSTLILSNLAQGGNGGGACSNILNNCFLQNNRSVVNGGGAFGSTLVNCAVLNNLAGDAGGGLCACVANSTLLSSNVDDGGNGGGACSNVLNNCVLQYNRTFASGAGAYDSALVNCTVVSNTASVAGGGVAGGSATNSIVFGNYTLNNENLNWNNALMSYCDTEPLPESGFGNITNDPAFVDLAANNFNLQSNSPCINSGDNVVVTSSTDFAGNPRIVGGTVDIGAYEYQTPASIISYAWLQRYGLPTDGSADFVDLDGTGLNVDQDWIAGLNPTNPASVLALLPPAPANNTNGVTVTWQSVQGINYFIQRSSNLTAQPAFTTIQTNLVGNLGSTSYTDTNAVGAGPYFYRVGVQ